VLDSRLYSLADELVPAATWATFATASDGVGDIANCAGEGETMQLVGPRSQTRRDTANGYRGGLERRGDRQQTVLSTKIARRIPCTNRTGQSELQPAIGLVL
jgi:hypothetical protein